MFAKKKVCFLIATILSAHVYDIFKQSDKQLSIIVVIVSLLQSMLLKSGTFSMILHEEAKIPTPNKN